MRWLLDLWAGGRLPVDERYRLRLERERTPIGSELPPLPPYIYGRECGPNERVYTAEQMRAYALTAIEASR